MLSLLVVAKADIQVDDYSDEEFLDDEDKLEDLLSSKVSRP